MDKKPKKRPTQVPPNEFFGKWWPKLLAAIDDSKRIETGLYNACQGSQHANDHRRVAIFEPMDWNEVRNGWPFVLLREAAKEGDREGYKRLLAYILLELDIDPPEGVLEPYKWPRGRPGKTETKTVVEAWESIGSPLPLNKQTTEQIAKIAYPMEWERHKAAKPRARNAKQKIMRDRVRATILRHVEAATKPPALS